ncbi:MAG TPA: D-glycerate dehydrogenase [Dehalococcoidia bacterium]|nr:D-glycerate dehydrogenase [Dehalococcoidia bacterium]
MSADQQGDPAARPAVYVATPIHDHVLAAVEAACNVQRWTGKGRVPREELARVLPGVVGLLTSNQVKLDHELILANPQLRVVSNFGVGYDNVDIPFATAHGLLVCNTPGVLSDAVADETYLLMLSLARRLIEGQAHVREGRWAGGQPMTIGTDMKHKTLGILGFGRIGHAVARRASGFGLRVVYYDPIRDPKAEDEGLASYAERDEVLREADFLSVHVFLDETTRRHIGRREFELMKPSAFFINTSRGPVVNQADLAAALHEGQIAGAALDVFEVEPLPADDPLLTAPNLLVAPHMASGTIETRQAMAELAGRNLVAAVSGRVPETMVNPEVLAAQEMRE